MASKSQNNSHAFQFKNFPILSPHLRRRNLVGIRPYRKGGIKLQLQKIQDKNIIYNYGHGGAGISLAPCCATQVADLAVKAAKSKKIAVLGSGIIGLMSALECSSKGFQVTIYADRIPQPNEKNALHMCTSQVSPGYWLPFHYQFSNIQEHTKRTELSYNKYLEWVKKSQNIYQVYCYKQIQPKQFQKQAPQFIFKASENIKIKIGTQEFNVVCFKTFQLNLQKFLQDLIKECESKGICFKNQKINEMEDILKLQEETIIGCLGLGSKKVFKDENVYGVKGHLIEYQNTSRLPFFLYLQFEGDLDFYCYEDKMLIGYSRQHSQDFSINEQTVKVMEDRAYNFMKYVGLDTNSKI